MNKLTIVEELIVKLQKAAKNMMTNALAIGKYLNEIDKDDLWKGYSNHLESFDDFLKDMDIPKSTGHHYMRAWQKFGEYLEEKGMFVPIRRLIALLPVTTEENKKEMVDKAFGLNESEFKREVQIKKGTDPDKCDHPLDQRQYFYQCKLCKQWVKIDKPDEEEED